MSVWFLWQHVRGKVASGTWCGDQQRESLHCWSDHSFTNKIKTILHLGITSAWTLRFPTAVASHLTAWQALEILVWFFSDVWKWLVLSCDFTPMKLGEGHTVQCTERKLHLFSCNWMQTGKLCSNMNHNVYCPPFGYQASMMQRSHESELSYFQRKRADMPRLLKETWPTAVRLLPCRAAQRLVLGQRSVTFAVF